MPCRPFLGLALARPCAERLVDLVRPRAGETCVDVLSEAGAVLRALRRGGATAVVGVDARGAPRMDGLGAAAGARLIRARPEALPLRDASAAVVTSLPGPLCAADPPSALAEMVRVLGPAGRLACLAWGPGCRHEAILAEAWRDAGAEPPPEQRRLLASRQEVEAVVASAGAAGRVRCLEVREVLRFDGGAHFWAESVAERPWMAAAVAQARPATAARLRDRCAAALAPHTAADGTVRLPIDILVLVAGEAGSRSVSTQQRGDAAAG